MKFQNKHLALSGFVMLAALIGLAGCSWLPFGKKSDVLSSSSSNDVLLSIDGKPALTVKEYEEQLDMVRKVNPQIEMLLNVMPNAEKELIFKSMSSAKLMKAWAEKEGIDKSDAFIKERHQLHEAMDMQLYMKYFNEAHPIAISDSDLEKFYNEKKDVIPALTLKPGGVEVSFVRFESKAKAEDYLEKTKNIKKAEAFKSFAEEHKHQLGVAVINEKSPFGEEIKKAILAIHKFPSVQIIKVGDSSYWVVLASGKSEAQYRDFKSQEVQQGLRKMMGDEQKEQQLMALIEDLKTKLNVVENTNILKTKKNKNVQQHKQLKLLMNLLNNQCLMHDGKTYE